MQYVLSIRLGQRLKEKEKKGGRKPRPSRSFARIESNQIISNQTK
jgi:hypothetical protein